MEWSVGNLRPRTEGTLRDQFASTIREVTDRYTRTYGTQIQLASRT